MREARECAWRRQNQGAARPGIDDTIRADTYPIQHTLYTLETRAYHRDSTAVRSAQGRRGVYVRNTPTHSRQPSPLAQAPMRTTTPPAHIPLYHRRFLSAWQRQRGPHWVAGRPQEREERCVGGWAGAPHTPVSRCFSIGSDVLWSDCVLMMCCMMVRCCGFWLAAFWLQ